MAEIQSDIESIKEFRNGNQNAFIGLVSKYQQQVYRIAFGIIFNHHLAEDISQETFVKLWKSLKSGYFDENRPIYPWVRTVCLNLSRDFYKKKKRQAQIEKESLETNSKDDCNGGNSMNTTDKTEKIRQAIESLDPERREVLILRIIEGLSYKEISRQLNCSIGTVMSRLFRARLELKNLLVKRS